MISEHFGLHLKLLRRHLKLTQKELSRQLNISRQAYSNYEQGRCLPPPDTLAEMSILLNSNLFSYFIQNAFLEQATLNPFPPNNKLKKGATDMSKKDFATILTEKRIAAGFTQSQAADTLYLARSTYNHYETGTRLPSIEVLIQMSILFKSDPLDLILPLIPKEHIYDFPIYSNSIPKSKISAKEKQILAYYRALNKDEQKAVLNMACLLTKTHTDIH